MLREGVVLVVVALCASTGAYGDVTIVVDPSRPAYKDQRRSRTAPDIGYAGSIADIGSFRIFDEFFVKSPDRTWEKFKGAGAHLVKEWEANHSWQIGMAYAALKRGFGHKCGSDLAGERYF